MPFGPLERRVSVDALAAAMMYDADLFRAFLEIVSVQALPQEVMARPGIVDRILEVASAHEPVIPPAPSREELLECCIEKERSLNGLQLNGISLHVEDHGGKPVLLLHGWPDFSNLCRRRSNHGRESSIRED
jgi:hypothetical protein